MPLQVASCNCYLPVDSKAFWKAFRCDSRNGFFASSYSNEVRTILWRLSSDYDRRKNCCRYGHFSALLITQSSYSFVSASARHCGTQLQRFIASDCSHGSLYPSLLSQQCVVLESLSQTVCGLQATVPLLSGGHVATGYVDERILSPANFPCSSPRQTRRFPAEIG